MLGALDLILSTAQTKYGGTHLIIPAHWTQRQEDQVLKIILAYFILDLVSNGEREKERYRETYREGASCGEQLQPWTLVFPWVFLPNCQ